MKLVLLEGWRTRRSVPEDLRRAQSRGEWPGARITFCLGRFLGGRVDIEGANVDVVVVLGRVLEGGGIIIVGMSFSPFWVIVS